MFITGVETWGYKAIGERIKQERNKMGLTRFQLAEKVDISTIRGQNRGEEKSRFSFETFKSVDCFKNTTLDYLAFGHRISAQSPERLEMGY